MVLDLGERRDWFESPLICVLAVTSVLALIAAVFWELRHKDPVLDIRLLGERNLGFSVSTMLVFGGALYASTVLLPLFMQTLMGYTAMLSGLAISPGGLVIMVLMPFIGYMVSRLDARKMIAFGILIISFSLFEMGRFNLDIDFRTIVTARLIQSLGMAFVFVPVNTVAYAYVARESRNSASSLISLARNIGGSIGIAFASSMIARGSQVHQVHLVSHMTPYDTGYAQALHQTTEMIARYVGDPVQAAQQAQALLFGLVQQQARTLAFIDMFRILSFATLFIIPMVWLMKRPPAHPPAAPSAPATESQASAH